MTDESDDSDGPGPDGTDRVGPDDRHGPTDGGAALGDDVEHVRLEDLEGRPGARALDGTPRVIRLALEAGESVPPHDHPGTTVVLHVVDGVLDARLDGESVEVVAGELVRFDGDREVAPRAVEDATALVFLVDDA